VACFVGPSKHGKSTLISALCEPKQGEDVWVLILPEHSKPFACTAFPISLQRADSVSFTAEVEYMGEKE